MPRQLAVSLLLALASCEERASEPCVEQRATYHVKATVSVSQAAKDSNAASARPSQLLATVWEDSSVLACRGALVTQATPGKSLLSDVPVRVEADSLTLDVATTYYLEAPLPRLWLQLVLDENGNGHCDDGEPLGGAPVARLERSQVNVALARASCPTRL